MNRVGDLLLTDAAGNGQNDFKIALSRRLLAMPSTTPSARTRSRTMADGEPEGLREPSLLGPIGPGIDRVEGRLKVTGIAPYAYEVQPSEYDGLPPLIGFIVPATVARRRIVSIDTSLADRAPGVCLVLTHANAPPQAPRGHSTPRTRFGCAKRMLGSDQIEHYGDPVAFAVADSFEQARAAALAIRVQ